MNISPVFGPVSPAAAQRPTPSAAPGGGGVRFAGNKTGDSVSFNSRLTQKERDLIIRQESANFLYHLKVQENALAADGEQVMAELDKVTEAFSKYGLLTSQIPKALQPAALDHYLTVVQANLHPALAPHAKSLQTTIFYLNKLYSLMLDYPPYQALMPPLQEAFGLRCLMEPKDPVASGLFNLTQPNSDMCLLRFPGQKPPGKPNKAEQIVYYARLEKFLGKRDIDIDTKALILDLLKRPTGPKAEK